MTTDDFISFARLLPLLSTLDQSETDRIIPLLEPVWLKKDEFFLKIGDPVTKVAFVDHGLLCRYWYNENGQKLIDQFLFDNQFFTDREGYYSNGHSFTNIQAIIPCHLWTISIKELEVLKVGNDNISRIIGEIIQQTLNFEVGLRKMLQEKDLLRKIHHFYDLHPHCWHLIPKRDIQNYLSISHTKYYKIQKK